MGEHLLKLFVGLVPTADVPRIKMHRLLGEDVGRRDSGGATPAAARHEAASEGHGRRQSRRTRGAHTAASTAQRIHVRVFLLKSSVVVEQTMREEQETRIE